MKLKRKTFVFGGVLVLVVLVVVFALLTMEERKALQKPSLKVLPDKVDVEMKDVLYTEIGDENLKWEIKADTARYVKKDNLAIFENVTVKLITAGGRTFVMKGDRGELQTNTKDIKIAGHIQVHSDGGDTFMTDHLNYVNSEQRITTDAPVTMENKRMEISGLGMNLSVKKQELSLLAKVRARIR